jgi:hypothetical protein
MAIRTLAALLALAALAALPPSASADWLVVGDCQKLTCAGACGPAVYTCGPGELACVGFSYQVPQCIQGDLAVSDIPPVRCMGLPCDLVNLACETATGRHCVE